jgi:hypothetical protein
MYPMTKEERDIQRKLKVLRHAEKIGDVGKTCRYFGVGRSSFCRWKAAYDQRGEAGLVNEKPLPKIPLTRRRLRSLSRSYTCDVNTTSGRSGSSGIWRATTASESPMQALHAFCAAMVLADYRAEPACAKSTLTNIDQSDQANAPLIYAAISAKCSGDGHEQNYFTRRN